ncbi:MAG TPA: phage holin family protein [Candidatus Pseudogracilibacillus intestinigallinarum]|uniref:Phage holin family protein n=1 Tax=Candidatus Pseudogracilibacillus intestinigallinarum TaxID=2838742 RepID=A0A9D1PKZ4_9BACI|nr:phage holin family protein [Candidatus Pseudogracilibacillus intestinigallinarum]
MFISWFISIFLYAVALIAVAQLFEGFYIENFQTALLASIVLSILNAFVRPLLIIFTLPLTIFTFGFFILVINTITLLLGAKVMGSAFEIDGFLIAFIASIIISLLNTFLHRLVGDIKRA